jgi:pyridoxine 5'-phosphate synthase PdxJ
VLGELKAKGMQVSVFSDAELARMANAAHPAVTKWADAQPSRGQLVKNLEAELAKLRGK